MRWLLGFLPSPWIIGFIALGLAAAGLYHWGAVRSADREGYRRAAAECEARIDASVQAARDADAAATRAAIERAMAQARQAQERAAAAEQRNQDYENEIASLPAERRACRAASDADVRRLSR